MISVEILEDDVADNPLLANPIQLGLYVLRKLREHKVPVIGTLWPEGVAFGRLTVYDDELLGARIYEWKND